MYRSTANIQNFLCKLKKQIYINVNLFHKN